MFGQKKKKDENVSKLLYEEDTEETPEKIPPVSMYSDITDEALETIHAQYTARYGAALHDESKSLDERSLETLAKTKEEIHAVQEFVKEYIYRQLKELALIIYLAMIKRNDYGSMGEDRVKISFMRNILNIPNNQEVDYSHVPQFDRILDECDKRHGKKSGDEYMIFIKDNWSLTLFNKKYGYGDVVVLIDIFDLIKVPYMIFTTHAIPYGIQFIFAECETMEYDKYTAYMLRREYIRSPQKNLSSVAEPYNEKTTVVRREALEVIAFNKYQTYLWDYGKDIFFARNEHINNLIGHFLKKHVFSGFGIDLDNTTHAEKKDKYEKIKNNLIIEMEDGVLWNQIGSLMYKENLNPVYRAFISSLVKYNDGIGNTYSSVLSDWFPRKGKCQGAMSRFCEIAEFDPVRAVRDVYMYLSDNWFTDEDDFMLRTTNVSVGLVVPFLNTDASVAFAAMAKEIPVIYALAFTRLTALYEKLIAILHKSNYLAGIHTLDYAGMEDTLFRIYQKSRNARSLEELRLFSPFWANMVGYLEKSSPVSFEKFQAVLTVEAIDFEAVVLDHISDGKAAYYHNSLREYIFTHFLEIGIIPKERERDVFAYLEKVRTNDEYALAYNQGLTCQHNGETEKALEYFNTALQKNNQSAQAFYKRSLVHKALRNMEAAFSDLKNADKINSWSKGDISADALSVLCFIEMGNLCVETDDKKGAIENYTKAIEQEPKNINSLIKRGDVYAETCDYSAAINDYTEVIKINAACIEAYEKRGAAYEKAGHREESSKDYAMAAYLNGLIFFNQNNYEMAIDEFIKALSFQNDFEDALLRLAYSYQNKKETEKALDTYNKLIEMNPNDYSVWQNLGRINRYYKKDIDMAITCFNKAIDLRPDLPGAFEDRGDLYHSQEKYKEAVDDFSVAINLQPSAVLYYKRGLAYANLHDKENTIKDYTAAIKNKPDYVDAYLQRGFTFSNMREYDKAIADFTKMAELAPNDASSYYYLGLAHAGKWEHKKAIEDYTLAIAKAPESFEAWLERANSKRYIEDFEGSLADYDEAIRLNPQHTDARYWKGQVYENLNDYEKAAQTFSEALEISPGNIDTLKSRSHCYIKTRQYDNAKNDYRAGIISLFGLLNQDKQTDMMQKGNEAFKSEKYDEAMDFFEKAIKNDPGNKLAVFNHSLTLILLNSYDKAASILSKIQWPDIYLDHLININSAKVFLSGMRFVAYSKIIDEFTLLIKNNPSDVSAYLKRGEAYQNLFYPAICLEESEKTYTDAVENYKSALEIEPGNEQIWFGLGNFFEYYSEYYGKCSTGVVSVIDKEAANYLYQAVENYTKALQLKADFIEALERRAGVYQKLGLDKKAEADLTAAIEAAKNKSLNK
jgi:tetratricopeptide (TPR) repeat protein